MYPIFFCLVLFLSGHPEEEKASPIRTQSCITHHVKTLQKEYAFGDTIKVKARGLFKTNGACKIAFGLVQKKEDWNVIADIKDHTVVDLCMPEEYYKNEVLELVPLESYFIRSSFSCPIKPQTLPPGEYRLTFITAKWGRVIHSNRFMLTDSVQVY
jgi:hypothetical protein